MTSRNRDVCTVVGCKHTRREEELACNFHYLLMIEADDRKKRAESQRLPLGVYAEMYMGGPVGMLPYSYMAVDPKKMPSAKEVMEHYGHIPVTLTKEQMEKFDGMDRTSEEWQNFAKENDFDPMKARIYPDGSVVLP